MKIFKSKMLASLVIISLLMCLGTIALSVTAVAVPDRDVGAYAAASPKLIGLGKEVVVNLIMNPAPSGPTFYALGNRISGVAIASSQLVDLYNASGFHGLTVTFTRPDGSKDTFMPVDMTLKNIGVEVPGLTESIGTLLFNYKPNQVGEWSVSFSYPGETFTTPGLNDSVYYKPATSNTFAFTVQEEPILESGLLTGWPYSPLPTGYWERPISINNREWAAIGGNWMMSQADPWGTKFNPYSTAPNTGHVLWSKQVNPGGIIGGDWGSTSYSQQGVGTAGAPPVIMEGRLYYNNHGGTFSCVDLRTGELIYTATGTITMGQHLNPFFQTAVQSEGAEGTPTPYLWEFTSTQWRLINPVSGTTARTITGVDSTVTTRWFEEGKTEAFLAQRWGWNTTIPYAYAGIYLLKWDLNKVASNNDWKTGIVWNVTLRQHSGGWAPGDDTRSTTLGVYDDQNVVCVWGPMENFMLGFDMTTGSLKYDSTFGFVSLGYGMADPTSGVVVFQDPAHASVHGIDVTTGKEKWETKVGEGPFAADAMMGWAAAYGNIYFGNHDGHVYSLDIKTGKMNWQSDYVGNSTETVFNTSPFYFAVQVADGKLYWSTSVIYSLQPASRFMRTYCIDAETGTFLWSINDQYWQSRGGAIADGYLVAPFEDGRLICFGEGKTETTISIQDDVIATGDTVLIKGTIMDMSPAQVGTPAIADEDQSLWMDYLHFQNASLINTPPSPQGVPVKLWTVDPNGNTVDIGNVTSDSNGMFKMLWTPEIEGTYTVYATFAGSESYWSSQAATVIVVTAAPTTKTGTEQTAAIADYTGVIVGTGIAVIIAVAVVGILLLRKKQ